MKKFLLLSTGLLFIIQLMAQDLPSPAANLQTMPSGSYVIAMDNANQNTGSAATASAKITISSGSNSGTLDDASGVEVGMVVSGQAAIPSGTTVTSVNYATNAITLSANATAGLSNKSVTFTGSGLFNMKAYGLIVYLLNNNVKLKWVINSGKAKDAADFTVASSRIKPTAAVTPSSNFKAGPFVIFANDTSGVAALVTTYNGTPNTGTDVNLYRTNADVFVDVRYDMTGFKPKAAILDDGTNASIHTAYMTAASIPSISYATEATGAVLTTKCYTFASEPHNTAATTTLIGQIRTFVQGGGNFLAQCEAVRTYENDVTNGRFHSTRGDAAVVFEKGAGGSTNATIGSNLTFPNPDLSYSQFEGLFNGNITGSLQNWKLTSGSSYINNAHDHAEGASIPAAVSASVSKISSSAKGGLVFYLGNHTYDVSNRANINGMRMYMNAFLTPVGINLSCPIGGPLPVTLVNFNATQRSNKVSLSWETALELNNDGFEIERRIGNGKYEKIAFVDSKAPGGNGTAYSYSFEDNTTLPKGVSYYRLRQVDFDGHATYSEIRAVRTGNGSIIIAVYPNPSRGTTNVAIPDGVGTVDISLNDFTGKSVQRWNGLNTRSLQLNNLKPGMYMLRISIRETGETITERISVQ